ncbi:WxL domain-containing protein [Enterococcus faecalis]|uniref:WxL domain-containing protein n=1 Tax=Enterococcus faecalis TaxID=1351 RepID=UPI003D6C07CD
MVYEEPVTRVVTVPAVTYQFGFVTEKGTYVYDAKVTGNATEVANDEKTTVAPLTSTANGIYQEITVPTRRLSYHDQLNSFYGVTDFNLKIPKYYKTPTVKPGSYFTGPANGYPTAVISNKNLITNAVINSESTGVNYSVVPNSGLGAGNYSMVTTTFPNDTTKTAFARTLSEAQATNSAINYNTTDAPMLYFLENRRINARYVDQDGNKLTSLPPDVKQDEKTIITSENFTFMHGTTLPDSYKGTDGKTYKFKGWYKGKSKPSTLKTTKQPSYQATFDDNDDLTVVYDSSGEKTATIPAITYKFGFVNEKGTLVAPTNFVMQTNLTTVMNETPKQVGTATGVNNGSLKHLTIPSQVLTYTPVTKPAFSGATDFRVTIPRYYKTPTVKPGTYYTGSSTAYPMATTRLRYTDSTIADDRLATDGQEYGLFPTTTPHSYQMYRNFWITDTNKTLFNGVLSRAITDEYVPNYYTTDDTMYYFLENRRVTENFVDSAGNKLPSVPTDFKQGQQTVINTSPFTYTSAKALPDSYKGSDGKTYIFKGWYKGKTKPDTLETTKTPSYKVTFDDNDDLNVVYEAEPTMTEIPEVSYQFGFVNEAGNLVNPTNIMLTYDFWYGKYLNASWQTQSLEKGLSAPTVNSLKELVIPKQTVAEKSVSDHFGPVNINFKLPKYYEKMSLYNSSGKIDSNYPLPALAYIVDGVVSNPAVGSVAIASEVKKLTEQEFVLNRTLTDVLGIAQPSYWYSSTNSSGKTVIYKASKPFYYHLTNRKVTEKFVDPAGAPINPPTGYTQNKQTPMTSNDFTFTQAGTLPATYKGQDGKTYIFKGWYKGKDKPDTLETTKTPSYKVTFDDNDDLNVVYEERVAQDTWIYPGFYAEFVDEQGKAFEDSLTFSGNYTQYLRKAADATLVTTGAMIPMTGTKTALKTNQYKIGTQTRVAMPADFDSQTNATYDLRGYTISDITIANDLKYVDKIETTNTGLPYASYPVGLVGVEPVFNNGTPTFLNELDKGFKKGTDNKFAIKATFGTNSSNATYPRLLRVGGASTSEGQRVMILTGFDGTPEYKHTMNYKVTRKQVTEKFVNPAGAPINPPTGYTQNKQTPMTSNTFTFTQAGTLPPSYKGQDGKTYIFKGWYKGKTKPSTLKTTKTPSYPVTFDGNDDLNVVYEEGVASVEASLKGAATIIPSGGNQLWNMTLKNTGTAPLTGLKVTPTANWSSGLAEPIQLSVKVGTGGYKNIPVTKETWKQGIALNTEIPVGQSATVMFSTTGTGAPLEVLQAAVSVTSNAPTATVSSTVRIQGTDQEVTDPVGEGFISLPTFDFGQVGIAGTTTQHGLKKAADYYGNGTRNPFVRIKKSQPNWSLTAQLSQPKSAKDSLPTATRLLLGQAAVSKVDNYNLVTEMLNPVGTTSALSLTANNAVTNVITNKQFTGNDVYHLDFNFNNVKLEVPANQGTKGEQYNARVTWNLVTGP